MQHLVHLCLNCPLAKIKSQQQIESSLFAHILLHRQNKTNSMSSLINLPVLHSHHTLLLQRLYPHHLLLNRNNNSSSRNKLQPVKLHT